MKIPNPFTSRCPYCLGRGTIAEHNFFTSVTTYSACEACDGTGRKEGDKIELEMK